MVGGYLPCNGLSAGLSALVMYFTKIQHEEGARRLCILLNMMLMGVFQLLPFFQLLTTPWLLQ